MYEQTGTLVKNKFKEHLVPTVLTTVALSLATVVDSVIVGQFLGSSALAAIGLSSPIIYFINIVYVMFGVGGMMCASVARGRRETDKADRCFTAALGVGVAVMSAFVVFMLVAMKPVCMILSGGDAVAAELTADYITPLVFTGPALIMSNGVALFMRADGKPKSAAMIVIVSNFINLVFDYVLIRFFNTGIMGAGLSTTLGYVVGIVIVLPYLTNRNKTRSFKFVRVDPFFKTVKDVIKAGLPKGCTYIAALGRALVLNSIVVATFGTPGMTVMTVLLNVLNFASVIVSGTCDTMLPIIGTLYGERDTYSIKKTVESAVRILSAAVVFVVIFFCIGSGVIGAMFDVTAEGELDMLRIALYMFSVYIPFYATVTTLQNFYNITGRERLAVAIAVLDGFVFICTFAAVLPLISEDLLWLCYGFGSACTFLTILIVGAYIGKKENVRPILLLRDAPADSTVWNKTIASTEEQAVGLTHQIVEFCLKHGIDAGFANRLGIGIEEMAVASIKFARKDPRDCIDIMIRLGEDDVLIRFRDNGSSFDPLEYKAEETDGFMTDGIALLKAAADEISYSNPMGFNITALTFRRNELN